MYKVEKSLLDAIETHQARARSWREQVHVFTGGLLESLEELEYVDSRWSGYGLDINVYGGRAELTAIWKLLRTHGWSTAAPRPKKKTSEWGGTWCKGENGTSIWLGFYSKTCVRTQVGTELKEVPVYDIVCSETGTPPDELI